MINRILIRIKVVQMLYSYLLTRSEFQLQAAPESGAGTDAKFAYRIYIHMLQLIMQLAGFKVLSRSKQPLAALGESNMLTDSKIAKALAADSELRSLLKDGAFADVEVFDDALMRVYGLVTKSAVYLDYRKKKRHDLEEETMLWQVILNTIIAVNPMITDAARTLPDFTIAGFKKGVQMAVQTLNEYLEMQMSFSRAKKTLTESLEKAYELYNALLLLPVFITRYEADRIEAAKNKYRPTDAERNPNIRFINNRLIGVIEQSPQLQEYFKKQPDYWETDYFMIKDLMEAIRQSELYRDYMEAEEVTFEDDCEFWRSVMRTIVLPSDALAEVLENRSIYWNDDLVTMGTFVLKTLKQVATNPQHQLSVLPIYKDEEDARFGSELFLATIKERDTYRSYIDRFINNTSWDVERQPFMDIVIMLTAIAELIKFPNIPLAVTMNEYVEIANYYSTPKSGQFINGLLFSVSNMLREEGKLFK